MYTTFIGSPNNDTVQTVKA